jgi:dihydropteroate synthase
MHMQGEPDSMQNRPEYQNVVQEVAQFLRQRIEACMAAGIDRSRILLDPGFGFGKQVEHNVALLAGLDRMGELGQPLLVGLSRKSMLVHLLGERTMAERLAGSLALVVLAVERGAWIVRAHDVRETVDAIRVASYITGER